MATPLQPKKIVLSEINGGNQFVAGDNVTEQAVNAPLESAAFSQEYVESFASQPDNTEADNVGTPTVEIIPNGQYKKFKFKNLKGKTGERGANGSNVPTGTAVAGRSIQLTLAMWQGSNGAFFIDVPNSIHGVGETEHLITQVTVWNGTTSNPQPQGNVAISPNGTIRINSNEKFEGNIQIAGGVTEFVDIEARQIANSAIVATENHNSSEFAHQYIQTQITNIINGTTAIGKALQADNYNQSQGTIKSTFDNINAALTNLSNSVTALKGGIVSLGKIQYATAQITQQRLNDFAVAQGYTLKNGLIVYDLDEHEWEYNGTAWVDNGIYINAPASNTQLGIVKGNEYVSILSGVMTVLKSLDSDKLGGNLPSYYATVGNLTILQNTLNSHINDKNNPHVVTAAQVGALAVNGIAFSASALQQSDTRATNELPPYYYAKAGQGQNFTFEFKESAAIGILGQATYCQLQTYAKWSDATGGNLTQIAVVDLNIFIRTSSGATGWGPWDRLAVMGFVQAEVATKIGATSYATSTIGGTVKMRVDTANAISYIRNDGTNA